MLEDVLSWVIVLVGAIVMRFTNFALIDPIMSIGVSAFVLYNAIKNLIEVANLFLEKVPHKIEVGKIKQCIEEIDGVKGVHHIHLWSIDDQNNAATMHVVADDDFYKIKNAIREELQDYGICHVTIEFETSNENCLEKNCRTKTNFYFEHSCHQHHHHGNHHH